jgi:fumarate reductase subunit D
MKRSNSHIFWLLFGAGGMLAALFGTVLVYLTGIADPMGWAPGADLLSYPHTLVLAQHWLGKGFLFAVIALFAWHAVHRILCSLHDVGIHKTLGVKLLCYGCAMAITLVSAASLLSIGF